MASTQNMYMYCTKMHANYYSKTREAILTRDHSKTTFCWNYCIKKIYQTNFKVYLMPQSTRKDKIKGYW